MGEEKIFFDADGLQLEGLLFRAKAPRGAIITHPHPLYGGNMHNNVVQAVSLAYQKAGYNTLRFNFRGVGESQGSHQGGSGEVGDVKGAVGYLAGLGVGEIHLAGYSFGAWVIAMALKDCPEVVTAAMVSPPAAYLDHSFVSEEPRVKLVITGARDDIAPPYLVEDLVKKWNPNARYVVVQGADHFYWGKEEELTKLIYEFLA